MRNKLGIIAALPFEAACFTHEEIRPGNYQVVAPDIYIFYAGMGPDNAARAAQALVDLNVDALVSWGVAASLDPKLASGDIVLPVNVLDTDGQVYSVAENWHKALKDKLNHAGVFAAGKLVSSHAIQQNKQLKLELHRATKAIALDMESAAVARVAQEANKPFAVIRSIFDTVAMHIPASSTNATDQYGRVCIKKLIIGLIKNPLEILLYPKLISSFVKARASLRSIVSQCGNELCFSKSP